MVDKLSSPLVSILKRSQGVLNQLISTRFEVNDVATISAVTNKPDQDY